MPGDLGRKLINEFELHVLIFIWNEQGHGPFSLERLRKLYAQAIEVRLLHQEDDIRPTDVTFGHNDTGVRLGACRANLDSGNTAENTLRGKAANAISAADEQQLDWMILGVRHQRITVMPLAKRHKTKQERKETPWAYSWLTGCGDDSTAKYFAPSNFG
jgi:hypothetical protein